MSEVAPGASVEFRSIETGFRYAASRDRVIAWLAGGFAALALLLSASVVASNRLNPFAADD